MPTKVDLRLPLAAGCYWATCLVIWQSPGPTVKAATLAVALLCLGSGMWLRLSANRGRTELGAESAKPVLSLAASLIMIAALVATATATTALSQSARSLPEGLENRNAPISLVLASSSREIAPKQEWQEPRFRIQAKLTKVGDWKVATPALLFGDDRWQNLPIGQTVTLTGRVKPPNGAGTLVLVSAQSGPTKTLAPDSIQSTMNEFRNSLAHAVADHDADNASLVAGLAIGDESRQTPALAEAMQTSGLSHLTAVSGGNTAIVLLLVLAVLRIWSTSVPIQCAVGGAALVGYLLLVGPQPSVLRATGMGIVALVGFQRGGLVAGLPVLSLASLALLLFDPALAVSLGFALSVAATAGLLLIAPLLKTWLERAAGGRRVPTWLIAALALTTSAQIATAPILLGVGNEISLAAVPANILVAPTIAPITVAGLIAAGVGTVFPTLATIVAWPAAALGAWIAKVAYWTASWEWASFSSITEMATANPWLTVGIIGLGTVVTLLIVGSDARSRTGRARTWLTGILLVATVVAFLQFNPNQPALRWQAVACNVGQGSATVLRGHGQDFLVDTGPEGSAVSECLKAAGVRRLAAIFLTHLHQDHTGALAGVLESFPTTALYTTAKYGDELELARIRALVNRANETANSPTGQKQADPQITGPVLLTAGAHMVWPGIEAAVAWPNPTTLASPDEMNNGGIVLRFTWDNRFSLLATGDIESESQEALLRSPLTGTGVDVATIPHHGSSNFDPQFPRRVQAQIAIASVGADNDYGHPTPQALDAYQSAGANVFRTDESDSIAVARDGDTLRLTRLK